MKKCPSCKTTKTTENFKKDSSKTDGLQTYCTDCCGIKGKAAYKVRKGLGKARTEAEWLRVTVYNRAIRYGLKSLEERQELLEYQGNSCAICKTVVPLGRYNEWHMDHDHTCCGPRMSILCGSCNRGLLCARCNRLLGVVGDSIELLEAAINYLKNPPAKAWTDQKEGKKEQND